MATEEEGLPGGLIIRALGADDLERLVRMDQAVRGRRRQTWYEGKLRLALEETDVHLSLGAELDGMLVGAVLVSVQYGEFGQPEPMAILDTILVDRAYVRQGIASHLLSQLMVHLHALRVMTLRTEVGWRESEMIGFFSDANFVPAPRLVLERTVPHPE